MQSFNFVLRVQADESGIVNSVRPMQFFTLASSHVYYMVAKKPYYSCVISYLAYECKRALF